MLNYNDENWNLGVPEVREVDLGSASYSYIQLLLKSNGLDFINNMERYRQCRPGATFEKNQRVQFGRMRTSEPSWDLLEDNDEFQRKTRRHGFTVSDPDREHSAPTMTDVERLLVTLAIGTGSTTREPNFGIPHNAKAVSFAHNGFEFGMRHCLDFKPTFVTKEGDAMEYYFKTERVQVVNYVRADQTRQVAGVCWWFGDDLEEHYNLHQIFELQRDQLLEDIRELRRKMRADPRIRSRTGKTSEELLMANPLTIRKGLDGQDVVLLDHDLGKEEKQRFEYTR